jgi:isoquinoline 1-oxidoreductase alpha subunit
LGTIRPGGRISLYRAESVIPAGAIDLIDTLLEINKMTDRVPLPLEETMEIRIKLNGTEHSIDADPDMPLLWAIRELAGLTGTKFGCGVAQCGACTVHLDDQPIRSCQTTLNDVGTGRITTIEGVSGKIAETVQTVWTDMDVPQCGYCQSGQIMSAIALLTGNKKPSDADIDDAMAGNLCRCATYHRIRSAIHEAARRLEA